MKSGQKSRDNTFPDFTAIAPVLRGGDIHRLAGKRLDGHKRRKLGMHLAN
jgi:hypothetical protein